MLLYFMNKGEERIRQDEHCRGNGRQKMVLSYIDMNYKKILKRDFHFAGL